MHDIHITGNNGAFTRDDGVWQDGGLLLHFPAESRWVGIFLAFQSQTWHTDDTTGHAIGGVAPAPTTEPVAIQILAAMANPVGPAPERETVLLLNASPRGGPAAGGSPIAQARSRCQPAVAPGRLRGPAHTGSNSATGGAITVLDAQA